MWRRDGIIREKREVVFPGTWTKVEIAKNKDGEKLSGWNLNNRQLRD